MKIDFDQIRELLAVVSQTEITELTIESGDEMITVRKAPPAQSATALEIPPNPVSAVSAATPQALASEVGASDIQASETPESNGLVPIASPMVGTFYRSPSPSAPPFVDIGDVINIGQTICIIEAMKLMNDLPSEVSGRIVKVCVENGTTVEYGQPLFMVNPQI